MSSHDKENCMKAAKICQKRHSRQLQKKTFSGVDVFGVEKPLSIQHATELITLRLGQDDEESPGGALIFINLEGTLEYLQFRIAAFCNLKALIPIIKATSIHNKTIWCVSNNHEGYTISLKRKKRKEKFYASPKWVVSVIDHIGVYHSKIGKSMAYTCDQLAAVVFEHLQEKLTLDHSHIRLALKNYMPSSHVWTQSQLQQVSNAAHRRAFGNSEENEQNIPGLVHMLQRIGHVAEYEIISRDEMLKYMKITAMNIKNEYHIYTQTILTNLFEIDLHIFTDIKILFNL